MGLILKQIIKYLQKDKVEDTKKEKLISRLKNYFIYEIREMSSIDILNCLLNEKTPDSLKEIISTEIDKLSDGTYLEKAKFKELIEFFKERKPYKEEHLKKDYFPKEFKKVIVDYIYLDSPIDLVYKSNLPIKTKQLIVDLKVSTEDAITLLGKNISTVMREYIIENSFKTPYDIYKVLDSSKVSEEIKNKILSTRVTKDNLFDVLRYSFNPLRDKIYNAKLREIEDIINSLTKESILPTINNYSVPDAVLNKILLTRMDTVIDAVKTQDKKQIEETLLHDRSKQVTDLIVEYRLKTIYEIIDNLNKYNLLRFLNRENIPEDLKEYLIKKREIELEKEIQDLRLSEIDLYYLRHDSKLPLSIQKRILEAHKSSYLDKIRKYTEDEVIKELKYCHGSHILNILIVQERINENNIFKLLKEDYLRDNIIDLILTEKKDLIRKYLEEVEDKKIFNFKLKDTKLPKYLRERIIEENKDIIKEKINKLEEDDLYTALNDIHTLPTIKKIILERFGVSDLDIDVCMDLLSNGHSKLLLKNFSKIRTFITESNINFESFVQYGSGSKKYSNWIEEVTNIISNNKIEEFIKCKNYFFNNFYDEYNEKENAVYNITNFLELINNFNRYNELCTNLEKNNTKLTKEDKLNIKFLFNVKNISSVEVPKTLEELSKFKTSIYQEYIEKIQKEDLSLEDMKSIFNDLIFSNASTILNFIGSTNALKVLKKDNSNSENIINRIDELLLYASIIEMVNDSNDKEGLKKVLEYTFSDINALTKMQNSFSEFENKVLQVYELDSKNNLTHLEKVKSLPEVLKQDLMEKYGGEVYDFSDKNYCLYAHVLSRSEKVEDLLQGKSSGKSNFISVSPISYKGQEYYWGKSEMILAFDKIPNGSFVCSSIYNMGSNGNISKNSSEVQEINRKQRGILETSAVTEHNSEALLYREGLIPCGLILPSGREPTSVELEYHHKYNLPFIVTQEIETSIENPKMILPRDENQKEEKQKNDQLLEITQLLKQNTNINKETDEYTGREVAIFTDCHSMYEPTLAVLEDIRRHGITEIYSLGDNVGLGPNPSEVFDLLEEYNVTSVAGNSEYYNTLGLAPFPYFYKEKIEVQEWTEEQLGKERISKLKLYPASIDLILGNKKLALCHFANDCRWDFRERSTHTYQANFEDGDAAQQFLYTNSEECKKKINDCITSHKKGDPYIRGYVSSKNEPLFQGKRVTDYDAIIQGHVHFHMEDEIEGTKIHTLRAVGMGYENDKPNTACYYVLKERKDNSFDIEKRLVSFNKNSLLSSIYTSSLPNKELVLRYVKTKKD